MDLSYLEGKKFCLVFVKVLDQAKGKVQLQCFRGRANVDHGKLHIVKDNGAMFTVPHSALPTVQPSDGTKLLEDADYYALVKTDENIQLVSEK